MAFSRILLTYQYFKGQLLIVQLLKDRFAFYNKHNVENELISGIKKRIDGWKRFARSCAGSFVFGFIRTPRRDQYDSEKEVVNAISQATAELKVNNMTKARQLLEGTLQEAVKKRVLVGLPCIYDMLATIVYRQDGLDNAEQILLFAIEDLKSFGEPDMDFHAASFLLKLARLYSVEGKNRLAEATFRKCLQVLRAQSSDGSALMWVSCLYWYGIHLMAGNRNEEALKCFESAYAASARIGSIHPSQIMVLLLHLGEVHMRLGNWDDALKQLLCAAVVGGYCRHPNLSACHAAVAAAYSRRGQRHLARVWYGSAIALARKTRDAAAEREAIAALNALQMGEGCSANQDSKIFASSSTGSQPS